MEIDPHASMLVRIAELMRTFLRFIPGRLRRWAIVGPIAGAMTMVACWWFIKPQPRIDWEIGTQPIAAQSLIGYSPGGRWLIEAGFRGVPQSEVVRLWEVASGQSAPARVIPLIELPEPTNLWNPTHSFSTKELSASPDDRELLWLVMNRREARFFSLETEKEMDVWTLPETNWLDESVLGGPTGEMEIVTYSPDGRWLLVMTRLRLGYACVVVERSTREVWLVIENAADPRFSRDGRLLVVREQTPDPSRSGSLHRGWAVWELETRRKRNFTAGTQEESHPAYVCHEGSVLITGLRADRNALVQEGGVRLIDVLTGLVIQSLPDEMLAILSHDENLLLTTHRRTGELILRDSLTGAERLRRAAPGDDPFTVATRNPQRPFLTLATAPTPNAESTTGIHATWIAFDPSQGIELGRIPGLGRPSGNAAVAPDGAQVALIDLVGAEGRHHLRIYDLPARPPWLLLSAMVFGSAVFAIAFLEAVVVWQAR